jgi:hypothetical protein
MGNCYSSSSSSECLCYSLGSLTLHKPSQRPLKTTNCVVFDVICSTKVTLTQHNSTACQPSYENHAHMHAGLPDAYIWFMSIDLCVAWSARQLCMQRPQGGVGCVL